MNLRIFALLMALVLLTSMANAGDKAAGVAANAERAQLLQTVARGASISSNNQQYQMLSGVRAAQSNPAEKQQHTLSRMGGGKLIETKGSFVIFSAPQQSQASVAQLNGTSYPTALNTRTGGIGIVPGTLTVKLKNSAGAPAIANDHGLEVVRVFTHLKTAIFRVKSGQDVVAVATALAADARIESAEVEVIEHLNVPH